MVLELNASDERGIGIVRGKILTFASTKAMFRKGFKMIILDEADAMTNDAQNALRRGRQCMNVCVQFFFVSSSPSPLLLCMIIRPTIYNNISGMSLFTPFYLKIPPHHGSSNVSITTVIAPTTRQQQQPYY